MSIVSLALLALVGIALLYLLIGFLVGAKRGIAKQGLALGLIIFAIPASVIVTKIGVGMVVEYFRPTVMDAIPAEYLAALEVSPTLMAFVEALPVALASPIIFGVVFFLMMLVLKIVYAIVAHMQSFRKENFSSPAASTWGGGVLGLIAAFAVFMCTMMPAVGYLDVASSALNALTDEDGKAPIVAFLPALDGTLSAGKAEVIEDETASDEEDVLEMLAEINTVYVQPVANNPVIVAVRLGGGRILFDTLSTTDVNGQHANVLGEVTGVANAAAKLEPLVSVEVKDFDKTQADAVRSVVQDLENSYIVKNIVAEVLSAVGTAWQNDEAFLGIAAPNAESFPAMARPVLDELIDVMATSTADTLVADLYTLAEVFGVAAENRVFVMLGGNMNANELLYTLSADGMLADVLVAFKKNDHMEGLIPIVINMGMDVIGDALGMPENDAAVYNSLMSDVTAVINAHLSKAPEEMDVDAFAASLKETAAKYGISFSDTLASFYAAAVMKDYTPGVTYTEAEVTGYFAEVAAYLKSKDEESTPLKSEQTAEDGLLNLGFVLVDAEKAQGEDNAEESRVSFTPPAEPPVIEETEKDTTAMLSGEKPLEHSIVTKEALKMDKEVIKEMTADQLKSDGNKITDTLVVLTDILDVLQTEEEEEESETPPAEDQPEGDQPSEETKPEETKPGLGLSTITALNEAGLGTALGNLGTTNLLKDAAPQLVVGALQAGGVVLPKSETDEIIDIIKKDNEANANLPEDDCSKGHKYGRWEPVSEPTCTEMGIEEHTCRICGAKGTKTTNAKGHAYADNWVVDVAAGCTNLGSKSLHCTRCDARTEITPIPATGHTIGEWYEAKAPACTKEGTMERACANCSYKENKSVAALGHTPGAWVVETEPTYEADGKKCKSCTVCGTQLESSVLPKRAHCYTSVVTAPTCTAQGYTTHTCGECTSVYVDDYVPALGHAYGEWVLVKTPTCTEAGSNERVCGVCGHKDAESVAALGHTPGAWVVDADPTYEADGRKHKSCTVCGTQVETSILPMLSHSYTSVVTAPTCTAEGYTTHTCNECGDVYVDDYVPALGHGYGAWTVANAPTCTEIGTEERACAACGHKETRDVAALGHAPGAWVVETEPTYEADGKKYKACTVCGTQVESSILPRRAHSYTAVVTAPTCTAQGFTTYSCSECTDVYVEDYVPALGHAYGEWIEAQAPTCTADGTNERTCAVCGHKDTETVKALGHKGGRTAKENVVAATCTAPGSYDAVTYCDVCDAETGRMSQTTAALGHKYDSKYTEDVPATATEMGSKSRHCKNCDAKTDVTEIPATGDSTVLESLVNSTSDLVAVIDHIKAGNLTEEELIADFDKLFAGLNPSTAKIVANVVNADLISTFAPNMKGDKADQLSKLIRNVVLSIADAEIDDYSAESALMSDMLHMAMNAKDSDAERLFNSADGAVAGKMGITAEAFVGKVLDSDIISVAIESANLGADPFGVGDSLRDTDVADFIDGANALFAESTAYHAYAERVLDFATLVGIELVYDATAHTFTQIVAE